MKKMKKIFAMLLAFTMILGMTMTASAETITFPSKNDDAEVTVAGLPEGLTVTAYQIVDATYYDENGAEDGVGFKGYAVESQVANLIKTEYGNDVVYDYEKPEPEHITTIANKIANDANFIKDSEKVVSLGYDAGSGKYEADLTAGAWIILIDNTTTAMYNPLLAGVYYTNDLGTGNEIAGGNINAAGSFTLNNVDVYVKSTIVPPFSKVVTNVDDNGNAMGGDHATETDIEFKITTQFPKYSKAYKDLTFKITDTVDAGLTLGAQSDVKVYVCDDVDATNALIADNVVNATATLTETDATYTLSYNVETGVMEIVFADAYIRANGGKEIAVTYKAQLNDSAKKDELTNTNNAVLTYTNDPKDESTGTTTDITYHHTFDFKIKKTDEKGNVLGNAEFELYTEKEENGNTVKTVIDKQTSTKDGYLTFDGLNAGTYKLKETKAPLGYQIDNTVREVVIAATYSETDGTMESYTITVKETGLADQVLESWTKDTTDTDTELDLVIMNTKLIALPSTGGIGTTIFTVAGCGIMIAAAFFFFASRKKEN